MQITVSGVAHTLKTLERFIDANEKALEIAWRLAEIGTRVASGVFGTHASVTPKRTENGATVSIDGEDVLFIEFGTGDAAGIHAGHYDAVPSVVRPGSWSETHSHQYEMLGYWWWHNTKFTETPPHPGAYDAYREMVLAIPQVAKEVFAT